MRKHERGRRRKRQRFCTVQLRRRRETRGNGGMIDGILRRGERSVGSSTPPLPTPPRRPFVEPRSSSSLRSPLELRRYGLQYRSAHSNLRVYARESGRSNTKLFTPTLQTPARRHLSRSGNNRGGERARGSPNGFSRTPRDVARGDSTGAPSLWKRPKLLADAGPKRREGQRHLYL